MIMMNTFLRLLFSIILIFVYVSAQTTSNDTNNNNNNNIDNIYYSNENCPAGYDCVGDQVVAPLQSIQPIPCDDGFAGFHCGTNYQFNLCESGYYCETPATIQICPDGSYCPQGATQPTKCGPLSICPEGSFQFRWLLILIIVLVVITLLIIAKVWHNRLIHQRATLMKLQVEKAAAESRTNSKNRATTETENSDTNSREVSVSIKDGVTVPVENNNKGDGKQRRASMPSVPGVTLSFEHVHVAVKLADGKEKVILHDVNGQFQASKLSAIMGPSGSGKTTFLSALTGRIKSTGNIRINGQHTVQEIQPLTGFVPQADTMYPMLTVRDILTHSAMTRLPAEWTHAQKMSRVERVVDVLGLRRVVDSVVGDEHNRGVSGGEKKRVSIGMELVADPLVLYLDEPTSGLDASSAKDVLAALQRVAQLGTTVITVIHQPRFDIFEMFDDVLFLAKGGYTVYFGPVTGCDAHFASLGHVQTEIGNPADFYMDIIHKHYANRAAIINHDSGSIKIQVVPKTESPQVSRNSSIEMSPVIIHHEKQDHDGKSIIIDPLQSTPEAAPATNTYPIATDTALTTKSPTTTSTIATSAEPIKIAPIVPPTVSISSSLLSRRPVGFIQQTWFYFRLSLLLDLRWLKPIATDTILQFIPGIALGIPSFGQDLYAQPLPLSVAQLCPEIIRDRCINDAILGEGAIISTFFITMVLGATACIFSVSTFGRYMAVFQREQSTGNNTTTSYWLAKCLYDLLHITRNCFIFLSLYELSASPHSTFGRWFITVWLLQFTAYGLGYFISTIVPFTRATVIAVVVAISLSVTSGLTPSLSTVENWNILQVFWYLSYNRWASEAMITMNVDVASSPGSKDRIAATIRETGYTVDWFSIDMAVLFALGVGYRILTWYMLQRRVRMNKMK